MGREMRELLAIRRLLLTPKQRLAKPLLARGGQTGAAAHCSRRADILSALDAHQPLSGSCQHWTPKADRMSAPRGQCADAPEWRTWPLRLHRAASLTTGCLPHNLAPCERIRARIPRTPRRRPRG